MQNKKDTYPSFPSNDRFLEIDMGARLADLKHEVYNNFITLQALIDLLVKKDLFKEEEITTYVNKIDEDLNSIIKQITKNYPNTKV